MLPYPNDDKNLATQQKAGELQWWHPGEGTALPLLREMALAP
jgi:hypothetical protein